MIAISMLKLCAAAGVALGAVAAAPLGASMPDRSWTGVKKILVLSQVTTEKLVLPGMDPSTLCARVQAVASKGAPVAVECSRLGDRALADPANAVLSFQGAVSDAVPGQSLFIFTIKRAAENGLEPAPIYFGSSPRAVVIGGKDQSTRFDTAVRASLGEILPWLNRSEVTH